MLIAKSAKKIYVLALSLAILFSSLCFAEDDKKAKEQEALKQAVEAYIYGYPLMMMDMTKRIMTNIPVPDDKSGAPLGEFVSTRQYLNAKDKSVTSPNADALYTGAWLDLSKEPYVLHIPNSDDRYMMMDLISGWDEVFANLGPHGNHSDAQDYVIVGPYWQGKAPKNLIEIKAPTNMVWVIGRIYCAGTQEDYETVHALQDEYKLRPLSAYEKFYSPSLGKYDASVDMKSSILDQVNKMAGVAYFKRLAELLKKNPPTPQDTPMIAILEKVGIEPGKDFDIKKIDPEILKVLNKAVKIAQKKIIQHEQDAGPIKNNWLIPTKTGVYGSDYLQRAFISYIDLDVTRPEEAITAVTTMDSNDKTLNGAKAYVIHFDANQIPPVDGFWSLTLYDDQFFFYDNPLNRYSLSSQRNALKYNADGSLDLYIQHDSPGKNKESNWLPAPTGDFVLMLRLYWPNQSILEGSWQPPAIKTKPPKSGS